ncbi:MAG: PepSY domain-containing protein [Rhodobacteraceae bacterium]|nr:PepSY domain-containing protein [Paracoccaceae bacterium]
MTSGNYAIPWQSNLHRGRIVHSFLSIISIFAALTMSPASPVLASGDECYVPMAQWQSRSSAILWAESRGWQVHRVKIDDGCYELYGLDGNGLEFEVKIDPSTFEIVEFEYESHGYRTRIYATDPPVSISDIELED